MAWRRVGRPVLPGKEGPLRVGCSWLDIGPVKMFNQGPSFCSCGGEWVRDVEGQCDVRDEGNSSCRDAHDVDV